MVLRRFFLACPFSQNRFPLLRDMLCMSVPARQYDLKRRYCGDSWIETLFSESQSRSIVRVSIFL
jgi:hypothetical protein